MAFGPGFAAGADCPLHESVPNRIDGRDYFYGKKEERVSIEIKTEKSYGDERICKAPLITRPKDKGMVRLTALYKCVGLTFEESFLDVKCSSRDYTPQLFSQSAAAQWSNSNKLRISEECRSKGTYSDVRHVITDLSGKRWLLGDWITTSKKETCDKTEWVTETTEAFPVVSEVAVMGASPPAGYLRVVITKAEVRPVIAVRDPIAPRF